MNIPDDISLEDRLIWEWYKGFCVSCLGEGMVIHEEPPRSRNPNYKPDERFLLCNICHPIIQKMPRSVAEEYLKNKRGAFAALYERREYGRPCCTQEG